MSINYNPELTFQVSPVDHAFVLEAAEHYHNKEWELAAATSADPEVLDLSEDQQDKLREIWVESMVGAIQEEDTAQGS